MAGGRLGQVEPRTDIGVARRGVARKFVARREIAHRGVARHGVVRRGVARRIVARRVVARRHPTRLSFVQRLQCLLRAESVAWENGSSRGIINALMLSTRAKARA